MLYKINSLIKHVKERKLLIFTEDMEVAEMVAKSHFLQVVMLMEELREVELVAVDMIILLPNIIVVVIEIIFSPFDKWCPAEKVKTLQRAYEISGALSKAADAEGGEGEEDDKIGE